MKDNRIGPVLSILFHLAVVVIILVVGLFSKPRFKITPPTPCTIPLEVMEISDVSQAPVSKPKVEKPKEQERPKDETGTDKLIEEPIPEEKPKEEPKPKTPPVPKEGDMPLKKKQLEEKTLEDIIKELEPEQPKPPPKKQKLKPAEKKVNKGPKNKGKGQEDFIKVLKDFDKSEDGPSAQTPMTDPNSKSPYGAARVGKRMSTSITDRVRRLLENAWLVPQRAQDGRDLVVHLYVTMSKDGRPLNVRVIHSKGTPRHPAYQVAVERALEAVAKCTPFPLPAEHYEEWKTLDIPFHRR